MQQLTLKEMQKHTEYIHKRIQELVVLAPGSNHKQTNLHSPKTYKFTSWLIRLIVKFTIPFNRIFELLPSWSMEEIEGTVENTYL